MKTNVFMLLALCATAAGATNRPKTETTDTLRTYELQNVQVTSTRATKTTPMAFKDLNAADIKRVNMGQDIPYLLSLTPSVTMTSDAGNGIGYTSLRIRGVDPSRINITSNGIPLNDAESAQVFWVNMGDFASSVESMQIQRGAGTSTNGAGAFGATLNMQTEHLGMSPFAGLDFSGGSYYSHKQTLRFGTGLIGEHWAIQGRLSNVGSKGYIDRASTKLNSYFLQAGYFAGNTLVKFITFNGTEQTYHAWNYTSKYEQSLYGRRYNSCGQYTDEDGNVKYYKNQTDNYHQQNYQLLFDHIFDRHWTFNAALHYTKGQGYYEEYKAKRTWMEYLLTTDSKMTGDLVRRKRMDNDFYGGIASVGFNNRKGLTAHAGGGWNRYEGTHFGQVVWTGAPYYIVKNHLGKKIHQPVMPPAGLQPDFEYYNNRSVKTDGNVYAKMDWEICKGLNAYADLQYRHVFYRMNGPSDKWDDTHNRQKTYAIADRFDFFNPKFGINYAFLPHHRVYASFAIAHKEPTRNNYQDNYGAHLKAERLVDWEAGYAFQSTRFSAGANFYYMNYVDQIVLTGALNEIGEMISQNIGTSYRVGLELEASWKPVDWFRWDANATFSSNKAKDWMVNVGSGKMVSLGKTPLAFSPDFLFNNIFTFDYKGFSAGIQSRYVGEQYLTNTGFRHYATQDGGGHPVNVGMMLDGYFNTDFRLSYRFVFKGKSMKDLTVGCTVYNLFSAKYDNNGWAAPSYRQEADGSVTAYTNGNLYKAGFAPQAPIHVMAHVAVNF